MTSLRDVAQVQARAFEQMHAAVAAGDVAIGSLWADVIQACAAMLRHGPARSPAHFGTDPLDHDADPLQSETERYWDEKTERRLERLDRD